MTLTLPGSLRSRRSAGRVALFFGCVAAVGSSSLEAQSLFNGVGLGVPTDPVDARSRALGNIGIGLWGTALLPGDPAAAAGITVPTALFTAQPSWVESTRDGTTAEARSTRFPLLGIAYPAWNLGTLTFSFGSFLDQRFSAERAVSLELQDGPLDATDEFRSEGGVSEIRLGLARPLTGSVAAGLQVGRYNGTLTRTLTRSLDGIDAEGSVLDFSASGRWAYSGTSVTAGASMNIGTVGRVAGSVTWSGDLEATPSESTEASGRAYDLPLQIRLGGTAVLAPGFAVTASFGSADWTSVSAGLGNATAQSARTYGAGVELGRAQILGRNAPLRFGYRRSDLPFALADGSPREIVWSGGFGLGLSETASVILAGVDLALERGTRSGGLIDESFWRAALTLRVAGF